jgi:KaiC/GvpD/RAD55 family RecA-like ATPase
MDKDFHSLYKNHLQGWKETGGVQAVALCHNHDDTKQSLSINWGEGLCYCFACNYKANAFQFATDVGHPNPKEFIVNLNGDGGGSLDPHSGTSSVIASPSKKAKRQAPSPTPKPAPDLDKLMLQYKNNLKANMDKFPHHTWLGEEALIDDVDVGINDSDGNFQFAHHNDDKKIITVRDHKGVPIGEKQCKWYLRHLFSSHNYAEDIFICAGEKDCLCLHSREHQCTSGTTGERGIPKKDGLYDLEWLQYYTGWIYICYDNDKTGREGAEDLANIIIKEYPSHKVAVIQWDENLPDGFDVFDAFELDAKGQDFMNAVMDAKEIKPVVPDTIGRFTVIGGVDAKTMAYKKTFQIVETLMPEGAQIVLGGQTGSNKSTLAMQWGGSLACDMPSFLDFKINGKGKSVLFIDTEVGKNLLLERREMMTNNFGTDWNDEADSRFNTISLDASSTDESDLFKSIEQAIQLFKPDVVFIDCLYNISDGMDISKNYNISKITTIVTRLKIKYQLTIVVVAHFTKQGLDQALVSELIAGGSHLQNWAEHIILLKQSGLEDNLRLLRIDKSRAIPYPKYYYGIELDERFYLSTTGMIVNPKSHLINPDKKNKWAMALGEMPDTFTTQDFRNYVENVMKLKPRTARNWLTDMVRCHVIERLEQGVYKKKLRLIEDEDE